MKQKTKLEECEHRLALINELLTDGYFDGEYDLQAVNQAHRVASGGLLLRKTKSPDRDKTIHP